MTNDGLVIASVGVCKAVPYKKKSHGGVGSTRGGHESKKVGIWCQ